MVITTSLARGLLRDTIARQSVQCSKVWQRARRAGLHAPPSLRRFREWFASYRRIFDTSAVLIVHGMTGRRRGVFTTFMPAFCEGEHGWSLRFDRLTIGCAPGEILDVRCERLPLAVYGHALERMFQRGETLAWTDVRDALADGLVFFGAAHGAYSECGCAQRPLPVSNGFLVGQLADGEVALKTFLHEHSLRARHARLLGDFRRLLDENTTVFHLGTASGSGDGKALVADCIAAPRHRWLRDAHEPGEDWVTTAWSSRDAEGRDECLTH